MTTQPLQITCDRQPSTAQLDALGVFTWPIWSKEASIFPWTYSEQETCYFLEGDVVVTPRDGEPVRLGKGDLATFPAGMVCTWRILSPVRKHYHFES